ncbi:MAG: ribosome recycling factor [Prevotella sp.]|nr:ribosome recycling factor [Prevotella sp.]MBQ8990562.1 ribosome recycling factor [Prevotella sp.]
MKRSIINQYTQLEEKYTGLVNLMNYRFLNLCIKAEEASLLPVKVQIEGELLNLEEVATMAKKNDYEMVIVPNFSDDMPQVAEGIALVHPEFKQTIDKLEVESYAIDQEKVTEQVPYILLTMPEVDDDRYDFLKKAVGSFHDDCKARMEAAKTQADASLAPLLEDESNADATRKRFDKLTEDWVTKREDMYTQKVEEIENAYVTWLGNQAQQEIARMKEQDALGEGVGMSMKLDENLND